MRSGVRTRVVLLMRGLLLCTAEPLARTTFHTPTCIAAHSTPVPHSDAYSPTTRPVRHHERGALHLARAGLVTQVQLEVGRCFVSAAPVRRLPRPPTAARQVSAIIELGTAPGRLRSPAATCIDATPQCLPPRCRSDAICTVSTASSGRHRLSAHRRHALTVQRHVLVEVPCGTP